MNLLTEREKHTLNTITSAVIFKPNLPSSEKGSSIGDIISDMLSEAPFYLRLSFRLFIWLIEYSPIIYLYSLRPLSSMKFNRVYLHLRRLETTNLYPFRMATRLLVAACKMAFYSRDEEFEKIGRIYTEKLNSLDRIRDVY